MTYDQALVYCRSQGAHLPTTREFAAFSITMGAQGLLESASFESVTPAPSGYYKVEGRNPDGHVDSFYFNHSGFNAQLANLGHEHLWTASIVTNHPDYAHVYYGEWGGGGGSPNEHKRDFRNNVRCIEGL